MKGIEPPGVPVIIGTQRRLAIGERFLIADRAYKVMEDITAEEWSKHRLPFHLPFFYRLRDTSTALANTSTPPTGPAKICS